MNYSIFSSRTFWTFFATFVVGGLGALNPVLPPDLQAIVMALLGLLGTYFHTHPSQYYNSPQPQE
jgi:hypothetical protein